MPIASGDIDFFLSGGAANSNPNASLGGAISSTQIVDATTDNLFDDVTGDESSAGDIEYRGFYVKNSHGSLTLQNAVVWIQTETPSTDSSVDIALADEGLTATMETIADESTAPAGPTFTHPTTKGTGLSLGNIPASGYYGIWIRRTISSGAAAYSNDGPTIRVEGDTAA